MKTPTRWTVPGIIIALAASAAGLSATPAGAADVVPAPTGPLSRPALPHTKPSPPVHRDNPQQQDGPESVTALIVKYRPGTPAATGGEPTGAAALPTDTAVGEPVGNGYRTITLATPVDVDTAERYATTVERDPQVITAAPDGRVRATEALAPVGQPNDPHYTSQWDLNSMNELDDDTWGLGINARHGWARTTGGSPAPVIAVLDTGSSSHPDLAGRWLPGYDMITNTLAANDGNGRDADPSDPGDWITEVEDRAGFFKFCGPNDSSWHGTHIAGTIGATRNNGEGITGLVGNARILPVRVLGKCGGYQSDIAAGITWASGGTVPGIPANPNPAKIINMSIGGSAHTCPAVYQDAINAAVSRGTTVVVAAGNDNEDASGHDPANCANVVTVAATQPSGARASYSNYGPNVDLAAPGGDSEFGNIVSTVNNGGTGPTTPGYGGMTGTSMAAPHVAAAAALYLSIHPDATPAAIENALKASANSSASGWHPTMGCNSDSPQSCGAGLLDVGALLAVDTAPSLVRNLRAYTSTPSTVAASWTAPRSPVSHYTVTAWRWVNADSEDPDSDAETLEQVGSTTTTSATTVTLNVDDSSSVDYVEVTATNSAGSGPTETAWVGAGYPDEPENFTVVTAPSGSTTVTWDAPRRPGLAPVTGYTVTGEFDSADPDYEPAQISVAPGQRSATLTGLPAYGDVDLTVHATNPYGTSDDAWTSTTVGQASAPRNLSAGATSPASAHISWATPAVTGGSPVTGYQINVDEQADEDGGLVWTNVTGPGVTMTGLAVGQTLRVGVRAVTALGVGKADSIDVWPVAAPNPVSALTVTYPAPESASVTWTAPADPNYSRADVTGYTATVSPAGPSVSVTGTAAAITGMNPAIDYVLSVRTTSTVGDSPPAAIALRATSRPPSTTPPAAAPVAAPAPTAIHQWVGVKKKLKRKKSFTIKATTTGGLPVTVYARGACKAKKSASGWKVTGKKKGTCTLQYSAPGNSVYRSAAGTARIKIT